MKQYIDKSTVVAEIRNKVDSYKGNGIISISVLKQHCEDFIDSLDTLETKDVDLIIHTIIAECCDWLASHTNLSHDEIEGCRNLMLTVKEEQLKAQKGE